MGYLNLWARTHRLPARLLITLGQVALAFLCLLLGGLFFDEGIHLPRMLFPASILVFAAGTIAYPFRRKGNNYHTRRRVFDHILLLSSISMTLVLGNYAETSMPISTQLAAQSMEKAPSAYPEAHASIAVSHKEMRQNVIRKAIKGLFLKPTHQIRANVPDRSTRVLFIVLTILGIAALHFGIAILACSIACSGAEALAVIFAIVANAGMVFGVFAILKALYPDMDTGPRVLTSIGLVIGTAILLLLILGAFSA